MMRGDQCHMTQILCALFANSMDDSHNYLSKNAILGRPEIVATEVSIERMCQTQHGAQDRMAAEVPFNIPSISARRSSGGSFGSWSKLMMTIC